jgi:magnesium chelatase family protein
MVAIVGGGQNARPGEVSLAHKGVLFLDELPEFGRQVLEALRQPMETGQITIARANLHVTYPARFLLVAAMNPCRCGYLDDPGMACPRAPRCAQDYQSRLSGPLLDRVDINLDVPPVTMSDMALPAPREGTAEIAARVAAARAVQSQRFADAGVPALRTNSEADGEVLERVAPFDPAAGALLRRASEQLHLSARGYHRVLRVARTIADLDGAETIRKPHLAEAVSFRRMRPRR